LYKSAGSADGEARDGLSGDRQTKKTKITKTGGRMKLSKSTFTMMAFATFSTAMLIATVPNAAGQDELSGKRLHFGVQPLQGGDMAAIQEQSEQGKGLKMWSYTMQTTRKGTSGSYTGTMVGSNPAINNGTTATTVYVLPLIVEIGSAKFDPTVADSCIGGKVPLTVLKNSPMVKATHDFVVNGIDVGKAQYSDAFQRANFWQAVSGLGGTYHNKLNYKFLPALVITPDPGSTVLYTSGNPCSPQYGGIEVNYFDFATKLLLIPYMQTLGVKPTNLPVLMLYNTTLYDTTPNQCCIGGYHGAYGSPVQTFSTFSFDTTEFYGPEGRDVAIMSHEINEWQDDPLGNNPTPAWGHVGQVSGCQTNLEVGDPLTGTDRAVVTMSGFNYHLQELAFFSWFYGPPSIGAGGKFSDNGTFTGAQALCK
jgi:hypothetical protein